jgi:predicted enzyme related to lactoylglutathione lyase
MRHTFPHPIAAIAAAALAAALTGVEAQVPAGQQGPPAAGVQGNPEGFPGKFVWADLFTGDSSAAARFYSALFGWTSDVRQQNGRAHIVMSNSGHPVAAIVQRPGRRAGGARARWIGYLEVRNAAETIASATMAGGRTLAPIRPYSRGLHAILADCEGSCIGIAQPNSDEQPYRPMGAGDWAWFELYAKNPRTARDFYTRVFDYQAVADTRASDPGHFILKVGDDDCAGIESIPDESGAQPDWLGFVEVGDVDSAVVRVPTLGGQVEGTASPGELGSRFAIISDPTGGLIGIVQFPETNSPAAASPPGDRPTSSSNPP